MALTPKQEKFAQVFVETGNASEAYRQAYDVKTTSEATINRTAKELKDTPKISARIGELRKVHAKRHNVTIDSLMEELEEARQLALSICSPAPAVQATMGKAKLAGLDRRVEEEAQKENNITINLIDAAEHVKSKGAN